MGAEWTCPPLSPGTEGRRAGPGSLEQEAGCLHGKQAEGRLWGVRRADALVPAACLALMPQQPRAGVATLVSPRCCVRRVWVEHTRLHVAGEAVPAGSSDLVSGLVETRGQAPAPSPAPASSAPTALVWRGLLLAASPLTYQHSPSKHRPVPHPFNKQPSCQAVCSSPAPAQGETEAERRGREPLGSDPPYPPNPRPSLTSWGTSPKLQHCSGLFSFLYHGVRLLLSATS